MIDPENIPSIADNELLARFIVYSDEKRSDGSVKHKVFLPYKLVELSVNRHREATLEETWQVGFDVAKERQRTLYGLVNIRASSCRIDTLHVLPAPILPKNPNHANISGYPAAKEDQMALAKKLAACIEGKWKEPP
ncbi:MAG TPA: hypothetical protein PKD64_19385 [Pirellulaceae bacterium]|nr:hypothetical protein [Pirellulaceae bacterium]HMO94355.1 hypothetical protein [Pirellulaceae bacterium]HMP71390.1 hypothetical protein [Pirellulaceae bacterium]